MGRFIFQHHDWQRNDSVMKCDDCQALLYAEYQDGHQLICGVEVEETGSEADRTRREEVEGPKEDDPTTEVSSKTTKEGTPSERRDSHSPTRRDGRRSNSRDSKEISEREAEATLTLFNMQ